MEQRNYRSHEDGAEKGNFSCPYREIVTHSCTQGLHINNTEYALLDASEDFMKTALVLLSGVVTDRIGGASSSPIQKFYFLVV